MLDQRADTLEALAAECGWPAILRLDDSWQTAYASRVLDAMLEIVGLEHRGSEWTHA